MVGLGFILNMPEETGQKAIWLPQTLIRFLGMLVDTANQRCMLPEEKSAGLMQSALSIVQSCQISKRKLAQMAGKMIAASPAIQLSKLFAGALY